MSSNLCNIHLYLFYSYDFNDVHEYVVADIQVDRQFNYLFYCLVVLYKLINGVSLYALQEW
jgi:flagellar assembly factor FliW